MVGREILIILIILAGCSSERPEDSDYECDYFNLPLPGDTLEIFAPGIVSSSDQEHSSLAISPDGKEMWWSIWELPPYEGRIQLLKFIEYKNGVWSSIKNAPFTGKYTEGSPVFSPEGNKIYFYSRRPVPPDTLINDNDIWFAERIDGRWSEPQNIISINTSAVEATPWIALNGNIYFASNRFEYEDPTGNNDLYSAKYIDGQYEEPVSLGDAINTSYAREAFPFVTPDESYIIFSRDSRHFSAEGELLNGDRKLMISFKDEKGKWKEAVEMGKQFYNARFPSVSPDGKYFFCSKYTEGGNEDIYWMDSKFISDLQKEYFD